MNVSVIAVSAVVYGGQGDNAEAVEKEIGDGDEIAVGSVIVRGVYTPCHTPGHVCYYARDDNNEKYAHNE
jgi:hydroxyacylglutathione hydrolase